MKPSAEILKRSAELLQRDFELEIPQPSATEEDLLAVLADHIAEMIEYRMEYLLSLMYRMDVAEQQVAVALSPHCPEPANWALARLVLARQKQRAFTKKHFVQEQLDDIEEGLEY